MYSFNRSKKTMNDLPVHWADSQNKTVGLPDGLLVQGSLISFIKQKLNIDRQKHPELAALAGFTFNLNLSAVLFNQFLAQNQSKSGPGLLFGTFGFA
jgi:hypothetical protein